MFQGVSEGFSGFSEMFRVVPEKLSGFMKASGVVQVIAEFQKCFKWLVGRFKGIQVFREAENPLELPETP